MSEETVAGLYEALDDPDARVRRGAVEELRRWCDTAELVESGALWRAVRRLDDPDQEVAEAAVVTLRHLVDGWGVQGLPVFAEVLARGGPAGRARAARLLGELDSTEAAALLRAGGIATEEDGVVIRLPTGHRRGRGR